MVLDQEIATYRRELPSLLKYEGKFVVIKGDEVVGFYDTILEAVGAGYDRFDFDPFLVHQVRAVEPIVHFTRDIKPWRK